jgi:hypothetical protein
MATTKSTATLIMAPHAAALAFFIETSMRAPCPALYLLSDAFLIPFTCHSYGQFTRVICRPILYLNEGNASIHLSASAEHGEEFRDLALFSVELESDTLREQMCAPSARGPSDRDYFALNRHVLTPTSLAVLTTCLSFLRAQIFCSPHFHLPPLPQHAISAFLYIGILTRCLLLLILSTLPPQRLFSMRPRLPPRPPQRQPPLWSSRPLGLRFICPHLFRRLMVFCLGELQKGICSATSCGRCRSKGSG